jgi:hypothetical protein
MSQMLLLSSLENAFTTLVGLPGEHHWVWVSCEALVADLDCNPALIWCVRVLIARVAGLERLRLEGGACLPGLWHGPIAEIEGD